MKIIGLEDRNEPAVNYNLGLLEGAPPPSMERISNQNDGEIVAETEKFRAYQVRWSVLKGVNGEGLLVQPKSKPIAIVIVLPDADQTPEQLLGLSLGVPEESQLARRFAENGYLVLIPLLVSRQTLMKGKPSEQTYREWIYRQAYHMGHHIIGYEVNKVMAAVGWFKQSTYKDIKIGVAGYCEGGLIALYAAAIDQRIDAVMVSGYFSNRQDVWKEPIYRNVFGLLTEFGDAEIGSLVAPRPILIEYSRIPETLEKLAENPVPPNVFVKNGYKGGLNTPDFRTIQSEFKRMDSLSGKNLQPKALITGAENKPVDFGSRRAAEKFSAFLGIKIPLPLSAALPLEQRTLFNVEKRQIRLVKELEDHVQWRLRISDQVRNDYFLHKVMPEFALKKWSTKAYHPYFNPDHFVAEAGNYRNYLSEEIIGKFEEPLLPVNARTRKVYDKERWVGYEVVLDVYTNFFTAGILLLPKDIQESEKRPVVVCQVGLDGLPQNAIEGMSSYNDMAARLVEEGFIVYCPYVLYRGGDRFRWLVRKANTVKKDLFSFMVSQHEQTLRWLGALSFVDKDRIAFYGKSYGGKTAMRIPAILEGYCLSICSGDFGDWTRKIVDPYFPAGYMNTAEWEIYSFDMGNKFSYAELAYLIFPRPFMVERGHHDTVQPDEWVAYEYAKVKYLYDQFNKSDKTFIEFFNGGHASKNEGTFTFLHKHLNWP